MCREVDLAQGAITLAMEGCTLAEGASKLWRGEDTHGVPVVSCVTVCPRHCRQCYSPLATPLVCMVVLADGGGRRVRRRIQIKLSAGARLDAIGGGKGRVFIQRV